MDLKLLKVKNPLLYIMPFKNIVDRKNWEQKYYQAHKNELSLKNKIKYKCECGIKLTLQHKPRHEKSKTHCTFIKANQ